MRPTLIVSMNGTDLPIRDDFSLDDMDKIEEWTNGAIYKRQQFIQAILDERPKALRAAYVLAKARAGEHVNWSEASFDLSTLIARFVDGGGREVEPVLELLDDGSVRLDASGAPVPVYDDQHQPAWAYADSGERVPFDDGPEPVTPASTPLPGNSSESAPGTGLPVVV